MRPKLDSTNIAIRDIVDQPDSPYILFVEGILGTKAAFAVHEVRDQGGMFVVYGPLDGRKVQILSFPYQTAWALVSRATLETTTVETWERKRAADIRRAQNLEQELYPQINKDEGIPVGPGVSIVPLMTHTDGTPIGDYR